ncbi:hypothetical protein VISI1226_04547 [Vibrio sinaloensis DSM 21326]|uniref:DUF1289 domain-containing protein n=1 Tax=Vibrio sinaloensis DSM 21326 TaxID=945550 RepID=E8M406_PHOS4|nr:cysteine-rich CWC family protein [Vibrio sinaloensis]EGA71258.1 hypothetical protein VISI1226_04547 [Vibrio sinaloensis DSM 21326]
MKSPCIAACKNEGGICGGCHRTMDEIINWRHLTEQERESVMEALQRKPATHTCPSCNQPAVCDISQGKQTCWCFTLEQRDTSSVEQADACLCRKCLTELPIA